jgi:thiamine-phosphate pyrophosphorylase
MKDFGLYIVMTSPTLGYPAFTEICVEAEVPMLQLREKKLSDPKLLELARSLSAITKGSKTHFIINDRADIAALCDADGLHLGPDDISWQDARCLLPKGKILGVSTHSTEDALAMIRQCRDHAEGYRPDYMSFGPIYPTVAKAIPDPPLGTGRLQQLMPQTVIPLVAIGGIFESQLPEILSAGARNICMIRYFGESISKTELKHKISKIKQALQEAKS